MAFGVKTKNIKTKNSYTIESFFDAIKDKFTLEKDAEYQQIGNYL